MKSQLNQITHVQVHTLNIKKLISTYEVARICRRYKVPEVYDSENQIYIGNLKCRGIKSLTIKQITKAGKSTGFAHFIELEINAIKVIGKTEATMIEMTPSNANLMFNAINRYLVNVLQLDVRNSDCRNWTLIRLDCGLDVELPSDITLQVSLMRAMNYSLNLLNKSNCTLKTLPSNHIYESIRFGNKQYNYNIYLKYLELTKKYPSISVQVINEIRNTLRIEIQLNSIGVAKKIGSPQNFGLLADARITKKLLGMVISDMKMYFGTGKYYSHDVAMDLIQNLPQVNKTLKRGMAVVYEGASRLGFQPFVDAVIKEAKAQGVNEKNIKASLKMYTKEFEKLGISVGGIDDMTVASNIRNVNEYVTDMVVIMSTPPIKQKRGVFSKIFPIDGGKRLKCQPMLKDEYGVGKRHQFTGVIREDVERKVLDDGIRKNLNENYFKATTNSQLQMIYAQAKDEAERFKTIVESPAVLEDVEILLNKITERMEVV